MQTISSRGGQLPLARYETGNGLATAGISASDSSYRLHALDMAATNGVQQGRILVLCHVR